MDAVKSAVRVLAVLAVVLPATAFGEIEKVAQICDEGICPRWWPKVVVPNGWVHDRDHSVLYNINAIAPVGKSFANAETVLYANALYKARRPELTSLTALIESDKAEHLTKAPGITAMEGTPIPMQSKTAAVTYLFEPSTEGPWERVAYSEEPDFFLIFVVSSQSPKGLKGAMPAFEKMVSEYVP